MAFQSLKLQIYGFWLKMVSYRARIKDLEGQGTLDFEGHFG